MLRRLLVFWLLLSNLCAACLIFGSQKVYSPDGQWRLWTYSGSGNSYSLSHGQSGCWFQAFDELPEIAAVSNDGRVAFIDKAWQFHLLDERGAQVQQFSVQQARIRWSSDLNLWFDAGCWWLETSRGQLFQLAQTEFQEVSEIPEALNDEATLRLAVKRKLTLPLDRITRMRGSRSLLAYLTMHGEKGHEQSLKQDREWRALALGAEVAPEPINLNSLFGDADPQLPGGLVVTGVLDGHVDELVRRLQGGDAWSATLLGRLDDSRSLVPLWQACESEHYDVSSSAVKALAESLGEDAAPELCRRIRKITCREELLGYFSSVSYPEVIPGLLETDEMTRELRRALAFQAKVDLGPELGVWRQWLESGQSQTVSVNPDAALWLAQKGSAPESALSEKPRLVQQFPAPGARKLGFVGDELLLLSGQALQPEFGWNVNSGEPTRYLPGDIPPPVPASPRLEFACSSDASIVALSGKGEIKIHTPQGEKLLPADYYTDLDLSSSGRWLARYDKVTDLTDLSSRRVDRAAYYARSAFDDQDRVVWGWPALPLQPGLELPVLPDPPFANPPALSPDGTLLVESSSMWDVASKKATRLLPTDEDLQTRWSSDSAYFLALPCQKEDLMLFRRDGRQVRRWSGVDYHDFCFSPDGGQIAFIDKERDVEVWDIQEMKQLVSIRGQGEVDDLCYSPDGKRLAVLRKGVAWVWEPVAQAVHLVQPRLASQLWTGRCLDHGQSRWLNPAEYGGLLQAWRANTGRNWP